MIDPPGQDAARRARPAASAARMAGDEYQHLYTWFHALQLLRASTSVTRIEFEAQAAGSVDDLIVHRHNQPALYHQIKFVVDQQQSLTYEWLTTVPRDARQSLLQRFYSSYVTLATDAGPPEMALLTNRHQAAGDPLLKHLDGRTGRLMPRIRDATPGSATGKARAAWAEHLGIDEHELLALLDHLQILPGRDPFDILCDQCGLAMEVVGLRGDRAAVRVGVDAIRELIIEGVASLDADAVRQLIATRSLAAAPPRATLVIQGIDRHPWPEVATAWLDWVDLFEGDTPRTRRQLRDPALWLTQLPADLDEAANKIRAEGLDQVRLEGAFRLTTGFAAGAALPRTAGTTIEFREYVSDIPPTPAAVQVGTTDIGRGDDLAIAVSVSALIGEDVHDYLVQAGLPVGRLVEISPTSGAGQAAVIDGAHGLGLTHAIFDEIRVATRGLAGVLHLFLCAPNGVCVLLGHLWNRAPTTQLYEDANSPAGYFPTYRIDR